MNKKLIASIIGIVGIIVFGIIIIISKITPIVVIENLMIYGQNLIITGRVDQIKKIDGIYLNIGNESYKLDYEIRKNYIVFEINNTKDDSKIILDNIEIGEYKISLTINKKEYKPKHELIENEYEYTSVIKDDKRKDYLINLDKNLIKIENSTKDDIYDIVIDPGHSLQEEPAIKDDINEAKMVLKISKLVSDYLEDAGYKVKMTRVDDYSPNNSVDPYGKGSRTGIAYEAKAKYLFSIHLNSTYEEMNSGGVEIYSLKEVDYKLAKSLADNIVQYANTTYSSKESFKVDSGVYVRNFTNDEVERNSSASIMSGYNPYDTLSTKTPYYYIIRETGAKFSGAYVDGRNKDYKANPYRYDYQGTESYLLELGYLTYKDDYNNLLNNYEEYAKGIAEGIISYLKK